jgi:hypothetical protein
MVNAPVIESIHIGRHWGSYSSEIRYSDFSLGDVTQLSFGGNTIYAYYKGYIVSSTGYGWQIVGESNFTDLPNSVTIASDETHI